MGKEVNKVSRDEIPINLTKVTIFGSYKNKETYSFTIISLKEILFFCRYLFQCLIFCVFK